MTAFNFSVALALGTWVSTAAALVYIPVAFLLGGGLGYWQGMRT
jgi:hypothetical protein